MNKRIIQLLALVVIFVMGVGLVEAACAGAINIPTECRLAKTTTEFNSCQKQEQSLKYVCYMMALDGLPTTKQGYFRLLETNKRVILPTNTHMRLLVSAADVLHS